MAKIFISHSRHDKELVNRYTEELRKNEHEILIDDTLISSDADMTDVLTNAIKQADGTLVFLTENSIKSVHVLSELGIAKAYEDNGKFLCILAQQNLTLPYSVQSVQVIFGDLEAVHQNVNKIAAFIKDFFARKPTPGNEWPLKSRSTGERVKEVQNLLTQTGKFKILADGVYGPSTVDAVRKFQAENNLPTTGEVDKATYDRLRSGSAATTTQIPESADHWLLKINEKNWKTLTPGLTANFSTFTMQGEKRPQYEYFEKINSGHMVLAYAYFEERAIVAIFEVTGPRHPHEQYGEVIDLKVSDVLPHKIPLANFEDSVTDLKEWTKDPARKLFPLSAETYNTILQAGTHTANEPYYQQFSQADFCTDSVDGKLEDKLNITVDVKALASVITYEKVTPPLAIGLFGTWGSGKSFFMKMLKDEIDRLSTTDTTGTYCKEVVHVWFNSWYYSDANLWASLVTKIFEDLQKKADEKKQTLEVLYKNLSSAKELREQTEKQKELLEDEVVQLETTAGNLKKEIKDKASKLPDVSHYDIVQAVFKSDEGNEDVKLIKAQLPNKVVTNVQQIDENLVTIGTTFKRFYECLKILWSFKSGKSWVAVAVSLLLFAIPAMIKLLQNEPLTRAVYITGVVLAVTSQIVAFLLPLKNKMDVFYKRLVSLRNTVDALESEEILQKKNELARTENDIAEKQKTIQKLGNDLDDISSGKKLSNFIENRVTDQRYINSLGIISWIRKDFEELGSLLRIQSELRTDGAEKKTDAGEIEQKAKDLRVNRIVLYIDDLDRCTKETVVRVLEAIHLLLAFDLFVVVVGVDPRWMYNALQQSYSGFFNDGDDQAAKAAAALPDYFSRQATPFDYLEKIFQIPFLVKPINPDGRQNLIAAQFTSDGDEGKKQDHTGQEGMQGGTADHGGAGGSQQAGASLDDANVDTSVNTEPGQAPTNTGGVPQQSTIARLKITSEEINFMKAISELIGDSPRTIKRFTNIYRIIRVHTQLRIQNKAEPIETYCAVMILLAIITGLPNESNTLLRKITDSKAVSLADLASDEKDIPDDLKKCTQKQYQLSTGAMKDAGDMSLETLRLNLNLVVRFSFRSHALAEELEQKQVLA